MKPMSPTRLVKPTGILDPQDGLDIPEDDEDTRQAEAWLAVTMGESQATVARRFEVNASTVCRWLKAEAIRRRTRSEDIDYEVERLVGVLEAATTEALVSYRAVAGTNAQVGPQYLKVAIDGVKEIARFRGVTGARPGQGAGGTTVVVRIGGGKGGEPPIEVGVQAS
jgi:transposase-like protein